MTSCALARELRAAAADHLAAGDLLTASAYHSRALRIEADERAGWIDSACIHPHGHVRLTHLGAEVRCLHCEVPGMPVYGMGEAT